jgi:predicted DNA-binding transcriptional regulator AlpA
MRFLDESDLIEMGVRPRSRAQRWRLIKAGQFPRPTKLGSRNAWPESEILAWLAERVAARGTEPLPRTPRSPGRPRKKAIDTQSAAVA